MKVRENIVIKTAAFLLAVISFAAAAMLGYYQLVNMEVLWGEESPTESYTVRSLEYRDSSDIVTLIYIYNDEAAGGTQSISQSQTKARLEEELAAENTNLRWYAQSADGTVRYGNTLEELPNPAPGFYWNEVYIHSEETMDLYLWLESSLPVEDEYAAAVDTLRDWQANRAAVLVVTGALLLLALVCTIFLCSVAGYRRGVDGVSLNWFHRIPGDLLFALFFGAGVLVCIPIADVVRWWSVPLELVLAALGGLAALCAAVVIGFLVTFVARCKAGTVFKNTLVWRLCTWCWRLCVSILTAIPLVWKVLAVGGLFTVFMCMFWYEPEVQLILCIFFVLALCVWAVQWAKLRKGAKKIIGGHPDYHIDTKWMLPDLKGHADALNSLGEAISAAVDDRMRSERFKAELITNVSHDLKTPLTSIINYVDLLKKQPIDDPTVQEYIEVLDRKSQRLKKLTEDLVEASKASTGNLAVTRERIGLVQLADQALAEYEERLAERRLRVVRSFPEEEVWVEADGRHLWRVLDNLLSNCAKYALEGTRVYLEIHGFADRAVLSVKNISREELNVAPELLLERFVRGDESRTTEGSGLGLSITQSLTELQQGSFSVDIDGDLFKATVTLPLAK